MTDDETIAREAIRATMAAVSAAADRGRHTEMLTGYTPDAVLDLPEATHEGAAAIERALVAVHDHPVAPHPRPFVRHHLTTSDIRLTGSDRAEGRTYFLVMTQHGVDHCGVYTDRFVRQEGRWLLSYRRVRLDWQAPGGWAAGLTGAQA